MVDARYRMRLDGLKQPRGEEARDLRLGSWVVRIEGLDSRFGKELDQRWGPFVGPVRDDPATLVLRVVDAGVCGWLPGPETAGELYRMESRGEGDARVVVSYNFALGRVLGGEGDWSLAITRETLEPTGRLLENAVRFLVATIALDHGGFAMHSAGVLHDRHAYIYAGPSRSGKSTAVKASAPARSLGDDFGLVVPGAGGWRSPALPFDGSERIASDAPMGIYPVAAIWRLYHSDGVRLEHPTPLLAPASLISCVAFPWAYPERTGELLDHVRRFLNESSFGHLEFAVDSNLYSELLERHETGS
jgi:hypothetical protein